MMTAQHSAANSVSTSTSSSFSASSSSSGGMEGSNVQVVVRCRPLTASERRGGDAGVIGCLNGNEVHVLSGARGGAVKGGKKVYTFDAAYGALSSQEDVYCNAVQPLVEEVLQGFNCTVFAYGQTGTGKTFTMEGELTADITARDAGVIPRSVHTIFSVLERQSCEYSVKVSFLELYNEELTDLLADDAALAVAQAAGGGSAVAAGAGADGVEAKELRIFEDASGKRGMLVNNLEEVIVTSAAEVFSALQRSWQRRRTAETLLNKNSSRSHCVFIITVHTKEAAAGEDDCEDIIKTGKLYLVDLAGSECVGKSGAQAQRAKEAGKINQSLLTLGRVINALVDKASYIPYRDSKLTRLLQESLGGRAKTVIIATVSPSGGALDETLSTLEYAHRAKNIRNRPQVNQKMSKRQYMKELLAEISSLKRDNDALRLKNGVYLPPDKYELMLSQQRGDSLRLEELYFAVKGKEAEIEQLQAAASEREAALASLAAEKAATQQRLQQTQEALSSTEQRLQQTAAELQVTAASLASTSARLAEEQVRVEERDMLLREHARTEAALQQQAQQTLLSLQQTIADRELLDEKIERKQRLEADNARRLALLTQAVGSQHQTLQSGLSSFRTAQDEQQRAAVQLHRSLAAAAASSSASLSEQLSSWYTAWQQQRDEMQLKHAAYASAADAGFSQFEREVQQQQEERQRLAAELDGQQQAQLDDLQSALQLQHSRLLASHRQRLQLIHERLEDSAAFASASSVSLSSLSSDSSAGLRESASSLQSTLSSLSAFASTQHRERNELKASLLSTLTRLVEEAEQQQAERTHAAVQELERGIQQQIEQQRQREQQLESSASALQSELSGWSEAQRRLWVAQREDAGGEQEDWKQLAQAAEREVQQLRSLLSSCLSELQRRAEADSAAMRQRKDDWSASTSSFQSDHAQLARVISERQSGFHSLQLRTLQDAQRLQAGGSERLHGCLSALHDGVCRCLDEASSSSSAINSCVQAFRERDYRSDAPSGRTPEKRKLSIVAQFASTPPHDELLHSHRQRQQKRSRRDDTSTGSAASDDSRCSSGSDTQPAQQNAAEEAAACSAASVPLPAPHHRSHSHSRQLSASRDCVASCASSASSSGSAIPVLSVRSSSRGNAAQQQQQQPQALQLLPPPAPPVCSGSQAENLPPPAACQAVNKPTLRSASRLRFAPVQAAGTATD